MTIDIFQRLSQLRERLPVLRLYALIDGAQYQKHRDEPLSAQAGMRSLFDGTEDVALAHAGPWLIDTEQAGHTLVNDLAQLEQKAHAVSWLITLQDLTGLTQLLQLHLNIRLPDGRTALLRFWDPRVLIGLAEVMDASQRESFFGHIHEWHLLHNGKRAWIGRHHADAQ